MRILIGWAWTYLIIAELVGTMSGISAFIHQQGEHFHFDNAYAGIMMIGIVGLITDQIPGGSCRFICSRICRTGGRIRSSREFLEHSLSCRSGSF